MSRTNKTRTTVGVVAALGAAALGVATLAGPALAGPDDTDRPKITKKHHDFGENWSLGAPRNGGHLEWELVGGDVRVDLTGNHYLTDKACGKVVVKYYTDNHVFIDDDESGLHCAPTNKKAQWTVSETFTHDDVAHVHEDLVDGSGKLIGSDTEDFD